MHPDPILSEFADVKKFNFFQGDELLPVKVEAKGEEIVVEPPVVQVPPPQDGSVGHDAPQATPPQSPVKVPDSAPNVGTNNGTDASLQGAGNQGGRSSRYPTRNKKKPGDWWVGDGTNLYAILEHTALVSIPEPSTRKQALDSAESKKWIKAEQDEIASLITNQTWTLVPPPPNRKTIGVKWVYKRKKDATSATEYMDRDNNNQCNTTYTDSSVIY